MENLTNNSTSETVFNPFDDNQSFDGSKAETFFSLKDAREFMLANDFYERMFFELSFALFRKEQFTQFIEFLEEIFSNFKTDSSITINVRFINPENTNFTEFVKSPFFQENIEAFDKFREEFQNFVFTKFQEKNFGISINPTLVDNFGNFTFFDKKAFVDFSTGGFTNGFVFSVRYASTR